MESRQQHIIEKVIVEVTTKNKEVAFRLKDTIDVFLKEEFFPSLESYFESLEEEFKTQTIQISKLNINVNSIADTDFKLLKEELKKQVLKQLKKVVETPKTAGENIQFLNADKSEERALLYFLEYGIPPWWKGKKEMLFWEEKSIEKISESVSFIKVFQEKISIKNVQDRLINQFLDSEIKVLLKNAFKKEVVKTSILEDVIVSKFKRLPESARKSIWMLYIDYFLHKKEHFLFRSLIELIRVENSKKDQKAKVKWIQIVQLIDQKFDKKILKNLCLELFSTKKSTEDADSVKVKLNLGGEKNLKPEMKHFQPEKSVEKLEHLKQQKKTISTKELNEIVDKEVKTETNKQELIDKFIEKTYLKEEVFPEEKGTFYIENAGLILLHPYLCDFFKNCDLLNEDFKIKDPELAVHLLHYMATKKEKQFENKMVFEKFLCGVPICKSIRRNIDIPEELKQKSEELLKAVISNWESLNNASTDLLRNEFLQRSGKINFKEVNPKIVVERKVHDILLDKIPWTISMCKLPWISKIIFTDW